jgi:hypothetical protein
MKSIKEAAWEWKRNCPELLSLEDAFEAGAKFAQQWISINDELPTKFTEYLCKRKNGDLDYEKWEIIDVLWYSAQHPHEWPAKGVTHWRYIELE